MKKLIMNSVTIVLGTLAVLFTDMSTVWGMSITGHSMLHVVVPPYLLLYYPTDLTIVLDQEPWDETPTASTTYEEGGIQLNVPIATETGNIYSSNSRKVVVPDVWAVRGITDSGTVRVQIGGVSEMVGPGGKKISLSNMKINDVSNNEVVTLNGMNPVFGTISMELNLGNLNQSGVKSGTYSTAFSITVTSI
jgi:hypothetical protein